MEKTSKEIQQLLCDPFLPDEIEWRVQQSGMANNPWALVMAYVDNRAIQKRLDDVLGVEGWEDAYQDTSRGMLCGITIHFKERSVTKWDGAETPRALTEAEIKEGKKQTIDPIKTVLSNSEKRAAVKFGIGRYLYKFEAMFVAGRLIESRYKLSPGGIYMKIKAGNLHAEWFPPELEPWALPSVKSDALIKNIEQATDLITLKGAYLMAYKYATSFKRDDVMEQATKAKDAKKLKLLGQSNQKNEQKNIEIQVWLERTVNDQIFGAVNKSVLKLNKNKLVSELNQKCSESGVNPMDLLPVLEKYYQQHLITLQP